MNIYTYTPYTYLIGWSKLNKFYYGVRYATTGSCLFESGCHPADLWVTYFTSSKYVRNFKIKYGDPDIIEIRKTFKSLNDAQKWENKVLQRMHVDTNDKFLNRNKSGKLPLIADLENSKEIYNKISASLQGNTPWNKGIPMSIETKKKLSAKKKEMFKNNLHKKSPTVFKKGRLPHNVQGQKEYFINDKGTIIVTDNLTKLAKYLNHKTHCSFSRLKRKICTTSHGWRYLENPTVSDQKSAIKYYFNI